MWMNMMAACRACIMHSILITAVMSSVTQESDATNQFCIVQRKTEKAGFHRDLKSSIRIAQELIQRDNPGEVEILIKELVPTGIYVDLYQVKVAEEFGGPSVYSSVDIDVEKPEYLSSHHDVYVFGKLEKTNSVYQADIVLPIHMRYHRPDSVKEFAEVSLYPAELFLKISSGNTKGNSTKYDNQLERMICDNNAGDLCVWKRLQCSYEPDDGIVHFSVPVGNQSHGPLVVFVTLTITITGTLFLGYSVISKEKKRLKTP